MTDRPSMIPRDPIGAPPKKGVFEIALQQDVLVGRPDYRGGLAWSVVHRGNMLDSTERRLLKEKRLRVYKIDAAHEGKPVDELVALYVTGAP